MDIKSVLFDKSATKKTAAMLAGAVLVAVVLGLVVRGSWGGSTATYEGATCSAMRGQLEIRINQSGELQAAESLRITPKIKGQATIVELVDEGTLAKKDDVICKLDSSNLEQQETSQAIEVDNAKADLTKAMEEKRIQTLSNETNISKALLDVATAKMDLEKYGTVVLSNTGFLDRQVYGLEAEKDESLGDLDVPRVDSTGVIAAVLADSTDSAIRAALDSTASVLSAIGRADVDVRSLGVDSTAPGVDSTAPSLDSTALNLDSTAPLSIDSTGEVRISSTGEVAVESTDAAYPEAAGVASAVKRGEAYQAFRDAELAITRARTDLERAQTDFDGMDKLRDRGFITKNDYVAAELKVDETMRKLESARLAHAILRTYTYPKTLAQRQADYEKARGALKQAMLTADAQMAQKEAEIIQSQSIYMMKDRALKDTRDRLANMVIKAPADGIVLYGDDRRPWEKDQIKVGGSAYEGQTLVTFPSITRMICATKVQEKDINRVKVGQIATITAPAIPNASFAGKVSKVSNVAASGNRWMTSTESKSFDVEVALDESDPRMKPGMSCKVSLLIDTVSDCVYVPVNAVFKQDGKDMLCLVSGGKVSQKLVAVGDTSDTYAIITDGLTEGSRVLMYNAAGSEASSVTPGETPEANGKGGNNGKNGGDGAKPAPPAIQRAEAASAAPAPPATGGGNGGGNGGGGGGGRRGNGQ